MLSASLRRSCSRSLTPRSDVERAGHDVSAPNVCNDEHGDAPARHDSAFHGGDHSGEEHRCEARRSINLAVTWKDCAFKTRATSITLSASADVSTPAGGRVVVGEHACSAATASGAAGVSASDAALAVLSADNAGIK